MTKLKQMRITRNFLISTLLALLANSVCAQVTISEIIFTNVVTINGAKQQPKRIEKSISRNRLGRLYARFTVIGTDESIKLLDEKGYLSIIAEWRINGVVKDAPEIGITQERWDVGESEFKRQVQENGTFSFRTTTLRDYIPIGSYQLTIRDGSGNAMKIATLEVTE